MELDIVIVEDNANDSELIIDALEGLSIHYKPNVINDGEKAVNYIDDLIEKNAHLPKLIILDLKLPKISGLEVLQKVKENEKTRSIPIVAFTSSQSTEDMRFSYKAGVNAYVVKPIVFEDFEKTVHRIGNFWLLCNSAL